MKRGNNPTKTTRLSTTILVVTMLGVGILGLHAQAPEAEPENPFAEKVIELTLATDKDNPIILGDVEVVTIGKESFLVGYVVPESGITSFSKLWIGLHHVVRIRENTSLIDQRLIDKKLAELCECITNNDAKGSEKLSRSLNQIYAQLSVLIHMANDLLDVEKNLELKTKHERKN